MSWKYNSTGTKVPETVKESCIVFAHGDTYGIKDDLKALGASWLPVQKVWGWSHEKVGEVEAKVKKLGVNLVPGCFVTKFSKDEVLDKMGAMGRASKEYRDHAISELKAVLGDGLSTKEIISRFKDALDDCNNRSRLLEAVMYSPTINLVSGEEATDVMAKQGSMQVPWQCFGKEIGKTYGRVTSSVIEIPGK